MDVSALYRGPLEDFIARRTALLRQLRSSDAEAAAAVAKLRKPPVSAWAIDQLAGEAPDLIVQLLAAAADAGEAQMAASAGTGSSADLLAASARVRDGVDAAVRAAATVLDHAGHGTGEATLRRIRTTIQAAVAGSPEARCAFWRGTLDRDLEPTGFGAPDGAEEDVPELAAVLAPLRRPSPAVPGHPARDVAALRAAERAAAEHGRSAVRAREMADAKRQHADRLAVEAGRAAEEAKAAEAAATAAEDAARAAGEALESLRRDNR